MSEPRPTGAVPPDRLAALQEEIYRKTRERTVRLEQGARREAEAIDRELAVLRDERQRLLDEQIGARSAGTGTSRPRRAAQRRETPPRRRVLMVLLTQPGAEAAYAWMETQMFVDEPETVH